MWWDIIMGSFVGIKFRQSDESFNTIWMCTFVRIFSFVNFQVNIQISFGTVRLVAAFFRTVKAFSISIVSFLVLLSVRRIGKTLKTQKLVICKKPIIGYFLPFHIQEKHKGTSLPF